MKTVAMLTLLAAIHAVESDKGGNPKCGGNEYQITHACVDDVNRILRIHKADWKYSCKDVLDPVKSRGIAIIYMSHYGERYRKRTGKEPTAKVYALIFHLGYKGYFDPMKAAEGERYWRKISNRRGIVGTKPHLVQHQRSDMLDLDKAQLEAISALQDVDRFIVMTDTKPEE